MKRAVGFGILALLAALPGSSFAAPRDAKEDLVAAVKKLAEAPSYAWTSTPQAPAEAPAPEKGGRRGMGAGGPSEGKTEKDGLTWISSKMGENTVEGVVKGEKSAVKTADGWKAASEFTGGQGGQQGRRDPAAGFARTLRNVKLPAAQAETLANGLKEVKAEEGVYSGDLTEEAAKALMTFGGGRTGGNPDRAPMIEGAGGSAKFWVKDGVLAKYEYKTTGKMKFGEREIALDRTTVVEIKDVGAAKVEVPDDAKAKLQ
jgi:hypothetical protein